MKLPILSERNSILYQVLQYCTEQQNKGKPLVFGIIDRWMINQERSRLWNDDASWQQTPELERKITKTMILINKQQ